MCGYVQIIYELTSVYLHAHIYIHLSLCSFVFAVHMHTHIVSNTGKPISILPHSQPGKMNGLSPTLLLLALVLVGTQADECSLTPVIHILSYPGCNSKPIPSFACQGRCTSYVQVCWSFCGFCYFLFSYLVRCCCLRSWWKIREGIRG